jgi:uncharacterized repeat protein (TIGR01451 family)
MVRASLRSAGVLALWAGPAWAQLATIHTVDTGGVGQYTSVAYGTDGLPLISYYDVTNGDLKVAHCQDVACATSTKQTIDSAGDVGRHTSIAIGADGRGIISYLDATNARLKVAHCNDVACSGAATVTLTNVGSAGAGTDIAIAGGIPTIAFRDGSVFKAARCADAACSDATVVSYPGGGNNPTIAVGADGLPLIAHDDGTRVFLGHCLDTACVNATFIVIFTPGLEGAFLFYQHGDGSLATGPDGRGVFTHIRREITPIQTSSRVQLGRCVDTACTALTTTATFNVGFNTVAPGDPAVAVPANDDPTLAWTLFAPAGARLQVAQCTAPACAGTTPELVDGLGVGTFPSLALSPAGLALIAYHDPSGPALKTAYLDGTPSADLHVIVVDSPDPVAPKQTLRYTLSAQNLGPNAAQGAVVSVALPPGVAFQAAAPGCTYDATAHTVTCAPLTVVAGATAAAGTVDVRVPPGLPGPLSATASISAATADPDPSNNSTTVSTATTLGLEIVPPAVIEGDSGLTDGRFDVTLLDDGNGVPSPLTVFWGTSGGSATPGTDYIATVGALTFTTASTQPVTVGVVGDQVQEPDETFFLQFSLPLGLVVVANPAATIVDDDVAAAAAGELSHGASLEADLRSGAGPVPPADLYRVTVSARASFEVAVDSVSGDVLPLALERLAANGTTVLQAGTAPGTGPSISLRWQNTTALPVANQLVRVRSGGCATDCGPDDIYRVRAYETTARIPRFNNTATQTTVLILQNPTDRPIAGTVHYWGADGTPIASSTFALGPRATSVTNTAGLVPGQSGSATVSHDASYGVLLGKAVALEPATGFSFDSPLEYRPR